MGVKNVGAVESAQISTNNLKNGKSTIENSSEITVPIGKSSVDNEYNNEFGSEKILEFYSNGKPMKVQITDNRGNIKTTSYNQNGEVDFTEYMYKNPDRKSVIEVGKEKLPIYDTPIGTKIYFSNAPHGCIKISVPDQKSNFLQSSMIIGDYNSENPAKMGPVDTKRTININLVSGKELNVGFGNKDNFNLFINNGVTLNKLVVHPDSECNVKIENEGYIKDIVADKSNDEIINFPCGTINNAHLGQGKNSITNFKGNIDGKSDTEIDEKSLFDWVSKIAEKEKANLESTCNLGLVHFGKVTYNSGCSNIAVNELKKTLEIANEDSNGNVRKVTYNLNYPILYNNYIEKQIQDKHGFLVKKEIRTKNHDDGYTITKYSYPKDSLMADGVVEVYDKAGKPKSTTNTEDFSLTNFPGYCKKAWNEFPDAFGSALKHYVLESSN